jgi:hypothetical protein
LFDLKRQRRSTQTIDGGLCAKAREELLHRLMEVLVQLEPEVPQEEGAGEEFEADEN